MAYDKDKFHALRSLEVPTRIALALADDSSPLNVEPLTPAQAVDDSVGAVDVGDVETKLNELLAALRTAGLMEESA